jgi:hypothetical protein
VQLTREFTRAVPDLKIRRRFSPRNDRAGPGMAGSQNVPKYADFSEKEQTAAAGIASTGRRLFS